MDDSSEPLDKDALLELIQRHRAELEATLEPLTTDQLLATPAGGWSIKDHLAHINAWEQSLIALLQRRPRHEGLGVERAVYYSHDVDAVNNSIYTRSQARSAEEVLADFHASHRQLLDQLVLLSEADLQKTYSDYLLDEPGEESGAPVVEWIAANSYHHYVEHLEVIRELAGS